MNRQAETTALMERELEDALGEGVTHEEADASARRQPRTAAGMLRENRLLVGIITAVVLVLAAMVGLATGSPLFVVLALGVHLVATYFVATFAIKLASEVEKPDPTTVARLQAGGVRDPEAALNAAVREHTGATHGPMTPSAVPTELVGPGSRGSFSDDD